MKKILKTKFMCLFFMRGFLVLFAITLTGCAGLIGHSKVPVIFRRAPVIANLAKKTLLIGPFTQNSPGFQAGTDVKQMIQRRSEKDKIFKHVDFCQESAAWDDKETTVMEKLDEVKKINWEEKFGDRGADYLVTGVVKYLSRDNSGYQTSWYTNRYGYTYPKKVYKDQLGYDFALGILMIDLKTGETVFEKFYEKDGMTEGAADAIGVFFDLAGSKIDEYLESIQGVKIRTMRFLLYN